MATSLINTGVQFPDSTVQTTAVTGSFASRAWVNFNGAGTVAIRASGNVSSITDNGTGDYTINFATAMPDANYSIMGMSGRGSTNFDEGAGQDWGTLPTASSCRVWIGTSNGSRQDYPYANFSFFR